MQNSNRLILLLIGILTVCQTTGIRAQTSITSELDLEQISIPESTAAAFLAWPSTIAANPQLELLPYEIIQAWGNQYFGVDPLKMELMMALMETPNLKTEPEWGCVMRFQEPIRLRGMLDGLDFTEKTAGYSSLPLGRSLTLVQLDQKTYVVGSPSFLEKLIGDGSGDGAFISELMNRDLDKSSLHGFLNMKSLRPLMTGTIRMDEVPAELQPLVEIPNLIEGAYLRQDINPQMTSQLVLQTKPGESKALAETMTNALAAGKEMLLSELNNQMDPRDPIQNATNEYMRRLASHMESQLQPKIGNDQLEFNTGYAISATPVAIALMLPAVQNARAAARRVQTTNNMRQLLLAMHNYHDAYRSFPTNIFDDDGKPLLSWRVQILPFIEQIELYEKFNLDEPWDSENNLPLVEQMPDFLKSSDLELGMGQEGHTNFLFVTGENMGGFGKPERYTFANITDGTSNTIGLLEVNGDAAVPWTKPADYVVNEMNPSADLGGVRPTGFHAGIMDGSIRVLKNDIDPETLYKMFTPSGGEIVDWQDW